MQVAPLHSQPDRPFVEREPPGHRISAGRRPPGHRTAVEGMTVFDRQVAGGVVVYSAAADR